MNAWVPSRIDHAAVRASCFVCHNDVAAPGKPPGHPTSTNDCELCHSTSTWLGPTFDHFGITAPCISCHNNMDQPGKPQDHIVSSDNCEECHNTRNWQDIFFDHSNITEPCANCHEKNPGHITSPNECEICHNTRNWHNVTFDHSTVTSNCTTCHSGDVPSGHFMTSDDCVECHTTTRWSPDTFSHTTPNYPGDHAGNLACTRCHPSNSELVVWERSDLRPDCAGCHASDFRTHRNRQTGLPYTVEELRDCTDSCHVEDNNRPAHRVNAREW